MSADKNPSTFARQMEASVYISTAAAFLPTFNETDPAITFTMEVVNNNKLPFIRMELIKIEKQLETCVCRRTTNKCLILKAWGPFLESPRNFSGP